jgi:DNA-binding transcriptional LysR family regulator
MQEIAAHDPIVMLGHRDSHLWEDVGAGASDPPAGRFVVNSIGFARELALHGQGVAILPNRLCAQDVAAGRLVRLLPEHPLPAIPVSGSFISRKHLPRKTRAFLDFVAERLIEEVPRTRPLGS